MSTDKTLSTLTRQELYDLVWSKPATKIAADFGVSDVAVAKRCRKLNVPKPSLGYWAKVEAGQEPPKKLLPPPPGEVFVQTAKQRIAASLSLPAETDPLHPLATELLKALPRQTLDSRKLASLRKVSLPKVEASKRLALRIAQSFHVILNEVEPLGINFRNSLSSYGSGFFRRGNDRLFLTIEEVLLESNGKVISGSVWNYNAYNCKPSGQLRFTLNPSDYGNQEAKEWVESAKLPLEQVLSRVVMAIRLHYVAAHKKRVEDAIQHEKWRIESERRHQEWLVERAIKEKKERERNHAAALVTTAVSRRNDLLKAAEWWRWHGTVADFIDQCERRWKQASGELTSEQRSWLGWARQYAAALSPFESGYPDPARDGAFDAASVPFGGPYPPTRNLPMPSTLANLDALPPATDQTTAASS